MVWPELLVIEPPPSYLKLEMLRDDEDNVLDDGVFVLDNDIDGGYKTE